MIVNKRNIIVSEQNGIPDTDPQFWLIVIKQMDIPHWYFSRFLKKIVPSKNKIKNYAIQNWANSHSISPLPVCLTNTEHASDMVIQTLYAK